MAGEHVEVKAEIVVGIENEIRLSIVRPEDMSEEGSKDTSGEAENELREVGAMTLLDAFLVVAVEYSDSRKTKMNILGKELIVIDFLIVQFH